MFFAPNAKCQNLDSLWHIWEDTNSPDTVRLKALRNYNYLGYLLSKPDSGAYFARLQYDYAARKKKDHYKADAGDFYWLEKPTNKSKEILFAVADCTGHGVPGAMVSVICNNGLNRSVREHNLTEPGLILDKTREIVIQEFEKSEDKINDGMDIALLSINDKTLKYAGANNPLWIIRNNEIIEIKGDKQPIGNSENAKPYITHTIELQEKDCVYIFTDGLVDQFGGENDKKFKAANLRKVLLKIHDQRMELQKEVLKNEFNNWRGNQEQVDDVCLFGFKIE